ncbi:MAG: response regulator [Proteobacteria bacterium]|nr:MAG: response regulator [Pseudomonadota bacterium]
MFKPVKTRYDFRYRFIQNAGERGKVAKPMRILIAEDDPGIRESLAELLESEGHLCRQAGDGQHATEILGTENFDILVSDFRMPRMNGVQLLQWCRAKGFSFPVLFITANRELFPMESDALRDSCADLQRKPIHIDEFLNAIHRFQEA